MSITAAELQANLAEYLRLAATEDIYITESGETVAKLTNAGQVRTETEQAAEKSTEERVAMIESLFGILPATMTLEEALNERCREL